MTYGEDRDDVNNRATWCGTFSFLCACGAFVAAFVFALGMIEDYLEPNDGFGTHAELSEEIKSEDNTTTKTVR